MDHALNKSGRLQKSKSGTFSHNDDGLEAEQEDMFTDKTKIRLEDEQEQRGNKGRCP